MNYAVNVFLKPRRLISISHAVCQLLKNVKRSEIACSKISRISSGCLLAGCCFSRQSDNETLLSSAKETRVQKNVNISDDSNGYVASLDSYTHVTDSTNMKRTSEYINETSSKDTDGESIVIAETQGQRIKTVIFKESTEELETAQQKLSPSAKNSDLSSSCIIKIVSRDPNSENITSEPPCKRTKTAIVDESIKDEGSVQQDAFTVTDSPAIILAEKKKERGRPQRQRPNYFVAIQISNDQIHKNVEELQNHIIEQDVRLKRSMINIKTLHITLMVMFIGDPETHARAKEALWNVHQELDEEISTNPLQLEFKGLSHFQNRVLYAKLSSDEMYSQLRSIAEKVRKHFAAVSIETTDKKAEFTPHLTVAKIDFKDKNKGIKKISPTLYSAFNDQYFGSQNVESIQLLSMTDRKTETGYYSGDTYYFSAFDPRERIKSLSKSLSVEEKKKDIKELISKLTKENLK